MFAISKNIVNDRGEINMTMTVFTLEDEQIIWTDKSSGICPSDVNLCCTVVDLFVSTDKSSGKNRLSRRPNIRRFVRRKICSSRLHIKRFVGLRRFVRPLVQKRPVVRSSVVAPVSLNILNTSQSQ